MNLMGIRKMGEMGLKMARSNLLPPRVKFNLQNMLIRGDFPDGNRPLGVLVECLNFTKKRLR